MCCVLLVWKSLVAHLRGKPIVRYEQVPFDIDDHIGEEFEREDDPLIPSRICSNTEEKEEEEEEEKEEEDEEEEEEYETKLKCKSPSSVSSITTYVTAESSEEDVHEVAF